MENEDIVSGALARGYTIDEIADTLSKSQGFDPAEIRSRGYSSNEILGKLGYQLPQPVAPQAPKQEEQSFLSSWGDSVKDALGIPKKKESVFGPDSNLPGPYGMLDPAFVEKIRTLPLEEQIRLGKDDPQIAKIAKITADTMESSKTTYLMDAITRPIGTPLNAKKVADRNFLNSDGSFKPQSKPVEQDANTDAMGSSYGSSNIPSEDQPYILSKEESDYLKSKPYTIDETNKRTDLSLPTRALATAGNEMAFFVNTMGGAIVQGVKSGINSLGGNLEDSNWLWDQARKNEKNIDDLSLGSDATTAEKIGFGVVKFLPDLALMAATDGASTGYQIERMGMQKVVEQLSHGATQMRAVAVKNAAITANDILNRGGSTDDAIKAATMSTLFDLATGGVAMGAEGSLTKRVASGIPTGAAIGEARRQAMNSVLPEHLRTEFDPEELAVSGITQGILHGTMGGKGHESFGKREDLGYEPVARELPEGIKSEPVLPDTATPLQKLKAATDQSDLSELSKSKQQIVNNARSQVAIEKISAAQSVDQAISAANEAINSVPVTLPKSQELADGTSVILQNRNRSGAGSIEQMSSIASAPDYGRLSVSRDFANGAPVVFSDSSLPQSAIVGKESYATTSDGRRIPVKYAAVEASDLLASNRADGSPNLDYVNNADGKLRAIAGNGRIAGLQEAYLRGTADAYKGELASDTDHGIDPSAIAQMKNPVLVRVMPKEEVTPDIGDVSNTVGTAALSPVEQAANDSRRVDVSALQFDDHGISNESVRQFVNSMPMAERTGMMNADGSPTRQAHDRLMAAVFHEAYGNEELVKLYAQAVDPESKTVLNALAMAAPKLVQLKNAGEFDIRDIISEAAQTAVNAKRNGVKLSDWVQNIDFTQNPETVPIVRFMAENIRSAKRIGEGLDDLASAMLAAHNSESAGSMFDDLASVTRSDVLSKFEADNVKSENQVNTGIEGRSVTNDINTESQAIRSERESGAVANEGRGSESFKLESESADEARSRIEAQERQAKADADEQSRLDKQEKQDRINREIESRQQSSADNFELGQSAEESLSGQQDIFKSAVAEKPQGFKSKSEANFYKIKNGIEGTAKLTESGWLFAPELKTSNNEKFEAIKAVKALNEQLPKKERVQPILNAPNENYALARELGKAFGMNVFFVSRNQHFDGVAHNRNVFLASDISIHGLWHPEMAIAGHEMMHVLERESPELSAKFRQAISQYLKDGVIEERQAKETRLQGKEVSSDYAKGEVLADLNGAMWLDPKFWQQLNDTDRNLFRQVAYKLMEVFARATKVFAGSRFDASKFVTDVDAVRKLIADTWTERNQMRDLREADVEGKPEFSAKQKTIEVDGVDRPTTNSNGKPIAETEEGIKNFWRWFGDSKVVDAEGKPLILYHGTTKDIDTFRSSQDGMLGKGIYLTKSAERASKYADPRGGAENANVIPVFVKAEKLWNVSDKNGLMPRDVYSGDNSDIVNQLIKDGYDGIKNGDEVVVFKPEQIKSAVGNNGKFDSSNPDIRFSRKERQDKLVEAWQKIAESEDTFKYSKSDKTDWHDLMHDYGMNKYHIEEETYGKDNDPRWIISAPKDDWKNTVPVIVSANPRERSVWINTAFMKEGANEGARMYQMVADWAKNNGYTFIGDPDGLSDVALRRRTEQMLASALKHGTTDHLMPHDRQVNLSAEEQAKTGVRPLDWSPFDTHHNIKEMLLTAHANLLNVMPEAKDLSYNVETDKYYLGDKELNNASFIKLSESEDARRANAGVTTLKRAAITNSILSGKMGEDGRLDVRSDGNAGERGADNGGRGAGNDGLRSISYSRKDAENNSRDLIITHNLTADNLVHADKMGGIPVPSLAVTKKSTPLSNFGDITLIGNKELADPRGYAKTKVFGADIYSPRYPTVEYDIPRRAQLLAEKRVAESEKLTGSKVDWREVSKYGVGHLEDSPVIIAEYLKSKGVEPNIVYEKPVSQERIQELEDQGFAKYLSVKDRYQLGNDPEFQKKAVDAKIAYYESKAKGHPAFQEFADKLRDSEYEQGNVSRDLASEISEIARKQSEPLQADRYATRDSLRKQVEGDKDYKAFARNFMNEIGAKEQIFKGYNRNGDRTYQAHTLENVVKTLKSELRGGEGFNYGVGSLRAKFTPEFKSIADIRANKDRLTTAENFSKVKDEINTDLFKVGEAMGVSRTDTLMSILEDAPKIGLDRAAKEYGIELSENAKQLASEFLTRLKNLPTEYFEAKILRGVGVHEFTGAVVPKDLPENARKILEQNGLKIREYGSDEDRAKVIEDFADELHDTQGSVLFSRKEQQDSAIEEKNPEDVKSKLASVLKVPAKIFKSTINEPMKVIAPMSTGSDDARVIATKFADAERKARYQWNRFDEILRKEFTQEQQEKMWNAADQENNLRREGRTSDTEGLNSLNPREREVVEFLHDYSEMLWDKAVKNGMVDTDGVHYWTPRKIMLIDENGRLSEIKKKENREFSKDARNLRTSSSSLKARKYETTEEAEAAAQAYAEDGKKAVVVRNIRTMPMAMAELERAIAGRELVNQIKALGQVSGRELVAEGKAGSPDFFTLDHPALRKARPMMIEDPETGKMRPKLDEDGLPVMERTPIFISKEFEGPIKSVLSTETGEIYKTLMELKSKSMGLIMMSPAIHLAVEWGRSFPAMLTGVSGKDALKNAASLGVYTFAVGSKAKKNDALMRDFIAHGLVPLGDRGMNTDIHGIADGSTMEVGKSWTAKALGKAFDLVNPKAGDAARKAVDKAGDFWHGTLLWNRIADLQIGLAVTMKTSLMNKGLDESTATTLAAHWANRYAGALPAEAMGQTARQIANLAMFSRSFTLGNLGLMKDMVNGLPPNRQAMIRASIVEAQKALGKSDAEIDQIADKKLREAKRVARNKAIQAVILDIGLMYAVNAIAQAYFENKDKDKDWHYQMEKLGERWTDLQKKFMNDPVAVLAHPFHSLESLTPQGHNMEGKRERIRVGDDKDGNTIYLRLPFGKVGEELAAYTSPNDASKLIANKRSPMLSGAFEALSNQDHWGHPIYNENDNVAKQAGKMAIHFMKAQTPWDQLVSMKNVATGDADEMDYRKSFSPFAGLTYSKVTGGDVKAQEMKAERDYRERVFAATQEARDLIKKNDYDGAWKVLEETNMQPKEIGKTLNKLQNPSKPLPASAFKKIYSHATDEQKEVIDELRAR